MKENVSSVNTPTSANAILTSTTPTSANAISTSTTTTSANAISIMATTNTTTTSTATTATAAAASTTTYNNNNNNNSNNNKGAQVAGVILSPKALLCLRMKAVGHSQSLASVAKHGQTPGCRPFGLRGLGGVHSA